jgi:soluble lytic murein transglycosylase
LNRRKLRPLPKIVISLFIVFILFLFCFGIREVFFRPNYPIAFEKEVSLASEAFGVDKSIIYSVIYCESSFDKDALSNMGAVGLMQLLPDTMEWLCTRDGVEYNEEYLYNPEKNIYYGAMFLSILYEKYKSWETVFAAYHAGHTRVDNWIEKGQAVILADGSFKGIPISATEVYVEKIVKTRNEYTKILEKKDK